MSALGLLQITLLAALTFGAGASLLSAALYPVARKTFRLLTPAKRVRVTFLWAAGPLLASASLTALCLAPSLLALAMGGVGDHCLVHDDHHVHLCLLHPPHGAGSALGWGTLLAAALGAVWLLLREAAVFIHARRSVSEVLRRADVSGSDLVSWVPGTVPFALTLGLMRPRVLIAEALRERLPAPLLHSVIAHELAHARRRDVLRCAIASFLALAHPPHTRRTLLADLGLASEQAADAEAAATEDPLSVAEAILAVERLAGVPRSSAAFSMFGGHDVTARVEALLNPAQRIRVLGPWWVVATAALALVTAQSLHHAVETLLTPLTR